MSLISICGQSFFMPNFDWLLQCVEDKMDVSEDFTDSLHIFKHFFFETAWPWKAKYQNIRAFTGPLELWFHIFVRFRFLSGQLMAQSCSLGFMFSVFSDSLPRNILKVKQISIDRELVQNDTISPRNQNGIYRY